MASDSARAQLEFLSQAVDDWLQDAVLDPGNWTPDKIKLSIESLLKDPEAAGSPPKRKVTKYFFEKTLPKKLKEQGFDIEISPPEWLQKKPPTPPTPTPTEPPTVTPKTTPKPTTGTTSTGRSAKKGGGLAAGFNPRTAKLEDITEEVVSDLPGSKAALARIRTLQGEMDAVGRQVQDAELQQILSKEEARLQRELLRRRGDPSFDLEIAERRAQVSQSRRIAAGRGIPRKQFVGRTSRGLAEEVVGRITPLTPPARGGGGIGRAFGYAGRGLRGAARFVGRHPYLAALGAAGALWDLDWARESLGIGTEGEEEQERRRWELQMETLLSSARIQSRVMERARALQRENPQWYDILMNMPPTVQGEVNVTPKPDYDNLKRHLTQQVVSQEPDLDFTQQSILGR